MPQQVFREARYLFIDEQMNTLLIAKRASFITLLLSVSLSFIPCASMGSDWEELLDRADSLGRERDYDSAIVLGKLAAQMLEEERGPRDTVLARVLDHLGSFWYDKFITDYSDEYEEALGDITRSLQIRSEVCGENSAEVASSLSSLGNLYNIQGQHARAESLYSLAYNIRRGLFASNHPAIGQSLTSLALIYKNQGRYDESEPLYRQALEIKEQNLGTNHPAVAQCLDDLALLLKHQGRYDEAEELYSRALAIRRTLSAAGDFRLAESLNNLATICADLGKSEDALAYFRQELELRTRLFGENDRSVALVLDNLGEQYLNLGQLSEAEVCFSRGLAIRKQILSPDHRHIAFSLTKMANLYQVFGRYGEAENLATEALSIFSRACWPENPYVAACLHDLSAIHLAQGDYDRAESLMDHALRIWEGVFGTDHTKVAGGLVDMSRVYSAQGHHLNAERACRKSLEITEQGFGTYHRRSAECLVRLGDILRDLDQEPEAETVLKKAMRIRQVCFGNDHPETAKCARSLANLYYRMGRLEDARSLMDKSLDGLQAAYAGDHADIASVLFDLGRICFALGDRADAERFLNQSHDMYVRMFGAEHPDVAKTALALARLYACGQQIDRSLDFYRQFIDARQRYIEYAFAYSSETQKLRWIEQCPLIDNTLVSLSMADGEPARKLALEMVLRGKSRVLESVMAEKQSAYCSGDDQTLKNLMAHSDICTRIANLSFAGGIAFPMEMYRDTLLNLYHLADSVESELSQMCTEFDDRQQASRITMDRVVEALPTGAVLWEIVQCPAWYHDEMADKECIDNRNEYYGFVLNSSGDLHAVSLGPASRIDSLVDVAQAMFYRAGTEAYLPIAADLERCLNDVTAQIYRLVFEPMARHSGQASHIFVSPDGKLSLLPLYVLPMTDGRYVLEDYRLTYVLSGRDLARHTRKRKPGQGKAVIVADPDFESSTGIYAASAITDPEPKMSQQQPYTVSQSSVPAQGRYLTFSRLRHSLGEGQSIARALNSNGMNTYELYGVRASEENLKALAENTRILHLATHGFFIDTDGGSDSAVTKSTLLQSGLALAGCNRNRLYPDETSASEQDGLLTALEVSALNLSGTALTTLSACETGVGEVVSGEGVFGLRRAFLHAGSDAVLMSLWGIPDKETARLMQGFYRRWLGGQNKMDALRETMLGLLHECRNTRGHGHPFFWGGFILVGNPN